MPLTSTTICPWDQHTCQQVNELIASCTDTQCILDKLAAIGLDVSELASDNNQMLQFAQQFQAAFMPHQNLGNIQGQ